MNALFQNRTEAGMALAELLGKFSGSGTVVLGIDRGGIVVAAELAHWLGAPCDLLPVQTIVLPCDQRSLLGAVAPGNMCVLDEQLIDRLDVEADAIDVLRCRANADLDQQSRLLRGERPFPWVDGCTVLLVDELIASALRMRAALLSVRQLDSRNIVVVAPVVTQAAMRELRPLVNEIVAIDTPQGAPPLESVYAQAGTASDAEIRRLLGVPEPSPDMFAERAKDD